MMIRTNNCTMRNNDPNEQINNWLLAIMDFFNQDIS
jgi:hypothetical protein